MMRNDTASSHAVLNLLHLNACPIIIQLQLEEALLRSDLGNWCIINEGTPSPAIVMGISGRSDLLVNDSKWQKAPIPIIKRFSGGGTVVVDHNTFFVTFICNSAELQVPCYPDKILKWTESFYQPIFSQVNFGLKENDYVIDDRKFGGNAQYLTKNRWLHHSSLLWDFDADNMEYLLFPPKTPAYRQQRSHADFLCCLRPHLLKKALFTEKIISALSNFFHVNPVTMDETDSIINRPHRKTTTIIKR